MVALEPKSLKLRDHFTAEPAFTTAPVAFRFKDRALLAAGNSDGRVYLLDAKTPGGPDHRTPLARSASSTGAAERCARRSGHLGRHRRHTLAARALGHRHRGVQGCRRDGALSLEPGWTSRAIASPLPPTILNDVVFAVASGLPPGDAKETAAERIKRAGPAVLYALDGRTGKELWNSGTAIASFAPGTHRLPVTAKSTS